MCIYKRHLYHCGHSGWGRLFLTCDLQNDFLRGIFVNACDTLKAHPLHSLKLEVSCPVCVKKEQRSRKTLSKIKEKLREAREKLARHRNNNDGWIEEGENKMSQAARLDMDDGNFREIMWEEHAASAGIDDGEYDPIVLEEAE